MWGQDQVSTTKNQQLWEEGPFISPILQMGKLRPEQSKELPESHNYTERESWAVLLSTGTSFWLAPVLSSQKGNFRKMRSWTTFLRDRGHGWWMYSGLRTKRPAWPWASSPRVTIFCLCYPGQVTFLLSLAPSGNNWASCWPHGAAVGSNEITNVKVLCKL